MEAYDLLIRGGTVIDGTGAMPFRADVAIKEGRIAMLSPTALRGGPAGSPAPGLAEQEGEEAPAAQVLDATGLYVTPGFIDIHSHSDFTLIVDPRAMSSIAQGVTLEVVGNCGHGCAPIREPDLARANIYGCRPDYDLNWRSMAEYLQRLEAGKPAVNVLTLVPNGNLRLAVAGLVDRPSTSDELKRMKWWLARSMEEGAFGFSTGLEYGPERACPEEEIIELCRVAAASGGYYATHTRNRMGEAQETIEEAIRTGAAGNLPLQISHISTVARLAPDGKWAVAQAIDQVDRARAAGLDVAFDMHTRLFGTTNLSTILPPWVLEGSKADVAARLRDPAIRETMKAYQSIITALARGDWYKIVLFDSKIQPEFSRKSIAEISAIKGGDPFDAMYDLLLAEIDDLHSLMVIAFAYRAEDIRIAFEHSHCMVGSDATALATDGPLQDTAFHGAYTWAAWYFRHFVRDTAILTPQEAIRRITSLPAGRLNLKDRGTIRPGAWADLAIFDPVTFAERGTTFEPNQTAAGMHHVLVNGVPAVRNGQLTPARPGQVLRHR